MKFSDLQSGEYLDVCSEFFLTRVGGPRKSGLVECKEAEITMHLSVLLGRVAEYTSGYRGSC